MNILIFMIKIKYLRNLFGYFSIAVIRYQQPIYFLFNYFFFFCNQMTSPIVYITEASKLLSQIDYCKVIKQERNP